MEEQPKLTQYDKFEQWIKATPLEFPEIFEHRCNYINPFIAEEPQDTYQSIAHGLAFIQTMIERGEPNYDFSLDESSTWGYTRILACLSGAIEFELKHRAQGGFEMNSEDQKRQSEKYNGQ